MGIKRIVITGGPGTGKSTIIDHLIKKGYTCKEEISREITLNAQKDGIDQLFLTHPLLFSELLLKGRLEQYNNTKNITQEFIFFDRGIPDILAYMDFIGDGYPDNFMEVAKNTSYNVVFILKPWKAIYKIDNERYESFQQAQEIHTHLLNTYLKYNYTPIDVPFGTVEERTHFILKALQDL